MYRSIFAELDARIEAATGASWEQDRLLRRRAELETALAAAARLVEEQAAVLARQELDVARLESGGLRAFLAGVVGDREARLDRERMEAEAARLRHDAELAAYDALTRELETVDARLHELAPLAGDLPAALHAKERAILDHGGALAGDLTSLAEAIGRWRGWAQTIDGAIVAGHAAISALAALDHEIESAAAWTARDLQGGGWVAGSFAQTAITNSRSLVGHAMASLAAFHRELADVGGHLPDHGERIAVALDGAAARGSLVEIVFDTRYSDAAVASRTDQALRETRVCRENVARWIAWLEEHTRTANHRIAELERARYDLIAKLT